MKTGGSCKQNAASCMLTAVYCKPTAGRAPDIMLTRSMQALDADVPARAWLLC